MSLSHTAPTMPFGRFKGQPLGELPDAYLLWLACLDTLHEPLLTRVYSEMDQRMAAEPLNRGATAVEPEYQEPIHQGEKLCQAD